MASNTTIKCPPPMKATSNGAFQGDNPLDYALPLAILQICLVVFVTRVLAYILQPLKQPRVIAEVIGGILLGPSALGRNHKYLHAVFPPRSLTVLDTLANLGLLFFLFLVGLELDPASIRRTGNKALSIALVGISLPFALGIGTSFVLRETIANNVDRGPFLVFMGVALSITAFPVLARILAELKLLTTDVGWLAMSAAAVNDVAAWILLALAIALSGTGHPPIISLWVLLSGVGFVLCCGLIFPPVFKWMATQCSEGEPVNETFICATLVAVLAAGFVTDSIGIHAIFGAFVVGILVPKDGPFANALVDKVEDLVSGLFLPLYFVSSGLKTNVATINGVQSWGLLVLVIFTTCFGKIFGTIAVSLMFRVPFREAVALGFLMNTKGLVELIVLNIGKDRGVLNDQTFAIMILMALVTTFITTPVVVAVYRPAKMGITQYKYRMIQRKDPKTQIRMLACFHSIRNISTLLNLIECSRGTGKRGGFCVYAMHLMELSERSSALRMVHKVRSNGLPFWNKQNSGNNLTVVDFETFEHLSQVSIRPMTTISSMTDMHEDVCASAEFRRTAIIILPFHKQLRPDGRLETTRSEFRHVNIRILKNAPCSVGILIDRGLGGPSHVSARNVNYAITVLFFGGCDDREALAYGSIMAEHPGINLTVIRFIADPDSARGSVSICVGRNTHGETYARDDFLDKFKLKVSKDHSITFEEVTVSNASQVADVIRRYSNCNMFIVGRTPEGNLVEALRGRMECPELGAVGNLLITLDFSTSTSVLVVQQYRSQLPVDSLATLNEEEGASVEADNDSS